MEAPIPLEILTINPDDDEDINVKMIDVKTYNINVDNKPFIFELAKSENKQYIIFKISADDINIKKYYYLKLTVNDFHNLNILFNLYNNIDEIYTFLLDIINSKNYSTVLENNSIILNFNYKIPGRSIDIKFELTERKKNEEDLTKKLYSMVEELIKENKSIKEELKNKSVEINSFNS